MHWAGLIDKVMGELDDGDGAGFGFVCAAVEDFVARVMKEDPNGPWAKYAVLFLSDDKARCRALGASIRLDFGATGLPRGREGLCVLPVAHVAGSHVRRSTGKQSRANAAVRRHSSRQRRPFWKEWTRCGLTLK